MSSIYDSPSADSLEHMRDDKILQKINDSYVRSLMKMMSSKVLKELRAENETIQKHLNALTKDVHLLAGEVSAIRGEDRGWHQEAMVAKLEALREDVQMSAAREKEFVGELGELQRKVEGRYEDLLARYRHLDKDLRTSLREFRHESSEEQQTAATSLQDVRTSLREVRSDLDEQRESLKLLQDMDFAKNLGEARQVLADLQEERCWHQDAMKKLRESHEDQKQRREEEHAELEKRTDHFRKMLESALPTELDKRDQNLTKQSEQLLAQMESKHSTEHEQMLQRLEKIQNWTKGRIDECLDQARLLDQDILDKMNPDLMLMKDQQQRLHETLNQVITRVPALAVGDAQVREECSIFRNDIGKLSQEIVQMGESLQHMMPWVDWLHDHQPAISCLEDRLAALEHARGEQLEINSEDLQVLVHRLSNCEKDQQDEHRCITELQSSCRKLTEDVGSQMRKVLGLEVLQRKSIINNEEFKSWRQDFDAMKVRVKRFEMNQLQEQKNLKTCQDNCSRYRKACEDIYAKYHQEMSQKQSSGNQQHEAYAKWREDAVAWQQEQMRKFQSQK